MKDFPTQIELAELIQKELDGSLTDEEFLRFQALLRDDSDAVGYYVKTILAAVEFSAPSAIPFIEQECFPQKPGILDDSVWEALAEDEVTSPEIEIPEEKIKSEPVKCDSYEKVLWSFKKSAIVTILINVAAMVLLVLFVRFAPVRGKSYACVMEGYQAQIQGDKSTYQAGQYLDDEVIKLDKGLLKILMNDGSEVLLEAPAEVCLEDDDQLFLIRGKMTANVPGEAIGFTVRTPSASIIDYGTQFGVQVDQYARTEAHVLKGNVKLGLGSNPRLLEETLRLSANQAGSVSGQILKEIPSRVDQFAYEIPSPLELSAKSLGASMFLHLQSDSVSSLKDVMGAVTAGDIEINPNLHIVSGPLSDTGKKSYAFRIEGPDSAIKINNLQSLSQSRNGDFTIGYWIRFDNIGEQVINYGRIDTKQGSHLRSISVSQEGFLEHFACDLKLSKKWRVVRSSNALRSGKWYFVLISRAAGGDNTKKIYIDGKQVSTNTIDRDSTIDPFAYFQFGGNVGIFRGFEGELSEIIMFSKALNGEEVQRLYEAAKQ